MCQFMYAQSMYIHQRPHHHPSPHATPSKTPQGKRAPPRNQLTSTRTSSSPSPSPRLLKICWSRHLGEQSPSKSAALGDWGETARQTPAAWSLDMGHDLLAPLILSPSHQQWLHAWEQGDFLTATASCVCVVDRRFGHTTSQRAYPAY